MMIIHKLGFVFPQLGALSWPQMSPRCVDCMWGPRCCAFCRHWWSMDVMDWTMRVGYIKHLQIKQATKSNNSDNNNNNNTNKQTFLLNSWLPRLVTITSQCCPISQFPRVSLPHSSRISMLAPSMVPTWCFTNGHNICIPKKTSE